MDKSVNGKRRKVVIKLGGAVRMLKPPRHGVRTRGEMVKPLSALKWKDGRNANATTYRPTNIDGPMYGAANLPVRPPIVLRIDLSICPASNLPAKRYLSIYQSTEHTIDIPIFQRIALQLYRSNNLENKEGAGPQILYRRIDLPAYISRSLHIYRSILIPTEIYKSTNPSTSKCTE